MRQITLFLSGAAVGAIAALLLAPESGEDFRARLRSFLPKKDGADNPDDLSIIMDKIASELDDE